MAERKQAKTYDPRQVGALAGLRVRKKLILLHSLFSLGLAVVLVLVARPVLNQIVTKAEVAAASTALERLIENDSSASRVSSSGPARLEIRKGDPQTLGLSEVDVEAIRESVMPVGLGRRGEPSVAAARIGTNGYVVAEVVIPGARSAVVRLYGFALLSLLVVYGLIALSLETFVLPKAVYRPIRTLLEADDATRRSDHEREIIPDSRIPADEVGEIMRSHNETVRALRSNERDLARALGELERVAADLKTKNDLLEAARRNLADADRLASLGMMSAGIAHEINTPLTVASGLANKLTNGQRLSESETRLLARVIARLERLGESLLDYARLRPPAAKCVPLRALIEEAFTLVGLDRNRAGVSLVNEIAEGVSIEGDPDRLLQVMVNLIRNAVDAAAGTSGSVFVRAGRLHRESADWVMIEVIDDGPGIDPKVLHTLFEPFVSTRLDAKGTGLGLAVAQGIVGEHGGTLVARNQPDRQGAVFEVILPERQRGGPKGSDTPTDAVD